MSFKCVTTEKAKRLRIGMKVILEGEQREIEHDVIELRQHYYKIPGSDWLVVKTIKEVIQDSNLGEPYKDLGMFSKVVFKDDDKNKEFEVWEVKKGWVGNNVLWLSHNNGRTIEIDKALKFNREEIVRVLSRYGEYIAWDCGHVNSQENAHKHIIDGQYLDIDFRITQYQFQK